MKKAGSKMKTSTKNRLRNESEISVTKSCGNVFADLGLENAEELKAKADISVKIIQAIRERGLTQTQAAALLGTHQTTISKLYHSNIDRFTFDKLLSWLVKLDFRVDMIIREKKNSKDTGGIRVSI